MQRLQPNNTHQPLPLGSVGSLRYLLSPAILQTCVRHQDVVWKILGFHQSKIGEGDSTAPAPTPAPAPPHEPHQWQQRPHYLSLCLLCFKTATCLTHRAMPRRKFPTFYPPALPFGLLRRLGLSKGTGHRAGGQVRLPSHTAQAQAVLLHGEVTFSPHLDHVVAVLSSKLAADLWPGLC